MTVRDLIQQLATVDPTAPVIIDCGEEIPYRLEANSAGICAMVARLDKGGTKRVVYWERDEGAVGPVLPVFWIRFDFKKDYEERTA